MATPAQQSTALLFSNSLTHPGVMSAIGICHAVCRTQRAVSSVLQTWYERTTSIHQCIVHCASLHGPAMDHGPCSRQREWLIEISIALLCCTFAYSQAKVTTSITPSIATTSCESNAHSVEHTQIRCIYLWFQQTCRHEVQPHCACL